MRFCLDGATKRHYMVVQEHVVGEDGGVPDAQPERSVQALHERHHLDRLAASYEPLYRLLDHEKHVPQRADYCRHEHRHCHAGVPIPRLQHLLARHALEEDAVVRDGGTGPAGGRGGLRRRRRRGGRGGGIAGRSDAEGGLDGLGYLKSVGEVGVRV